MKEMDGKVVTRYLWSSRNNWELVGERKKTKYISAGFIGKENHVLMLIQ